jgi:hypothetical protein
MSYADLEIRILKREPAGYPVEVTLDFGQEFPRGYLDPVFLTSAPDAPAGDWVPPADPRTAGARLFRWLTADPELAKAWERARGSRPQRRIRLRIDPDSPELHAIPWELLREEVTLRGPAGNGAAGPDGSSPSQQLLGIDLAASSATPFSRYLAGAWQPGGPILKRPLRILVAIASPSGLGSDDWVDFAPIQEEIEWAVLQEAVAGQNVELTRYPQPARPVWVSSAEGEPEPVGGNPAPLTLLKLQTELSKGYHILHLICHGSFSKKTGEAALFLADEDDKVRLVRDVELAEMLARQLAGADGTADDRLRLVFLHSCQTAARSPADAFRGLAPKLVAAGVPAVLAMQDRVEMGTARQFAAVFYRQLLEHGQVDLAANEARAAVIGAFRSGAEVPVLFMRLRDGRLLAQRGTITAGREEIFWPTLLQRIYMGLCTAFLGPRVTTGLLPPAEVVAELLADANNYPCSDRQNLARVAQYVASIDRGKLRTDYLWILQRGLFQSLGIKPTAEQRRRFEKAGLDATIEALEWARLSLVDHEDEVHHLLADLPLPLYVTTNADSFMFQALRQRGRRPARFGLRWLPPEPGTPQFVLGEPSPDAPVVLHLNGYDGDPLQRQHLVLSEDDYLAHFLRLSTDQDTVLPADFLKLLSEHTFLFLGYQLEDWEFRVLLQGLIGRIAGINPEQKLHIGVQLDMDQAIDAKRARQYLQRYLGRFRIEIYWGTPQQFALELHSEWQVYLEKMGDGWKS